MAENMVAEEKQTLVTGSQKKSQSLDSNAILLTTGATEATNLQNISTNIKGTTIVKPQYDKIEADKFYEENHYLWKFSFYLQLILFRSAVFLL